MGIRIHFFENCTSENSIALAIAMGLGPVGEPRDPDAKRFDRLQQEAGKYFQTADIEDADVCVYPGFYDHSEEVRLAAQMAKEAGKPCVFFNCDDSLTPVNLPWGHCYRASILASRQTASERGLPTFADDLLREYGGEVQLRPYRRGKPVVGFCGYVGTGFKRTFYRLLGRSNKVQGLFLRKKILALLEKHPHVNCNFIYRTQYWGGATSRFKTDFDSKHEVRSTYLSNLLSSDYNLCLRGAGNFSFRLYETLSMGRIPLFINTDCVLPFDDKIDWRSHCVWIEEKEMKQAGSILSDFHASLSEEEFCNLQISNRKLWEDYLRPLECYRQIFAESLSEYA